MTANKKNQEFKIRKIRRNIEYSFRDSDRYFDLFIVFLVAGIVLWAVMHVIFDVCIDSWMADPKLLNFQYMWNVLMKVIPYTLWAFAGGFLIVYVRNPLNELINGGIRIFRLKRRMRRENSFREGNNDASH
ncbi:conjugal transfer protein TrbF [Escherichia coli]|uniref:F-type conjugal transfer protein TrbF n=2 Tax=Escherichia coli TaxID=562 RepID=UPI000C1C2174|nr:F-type conjugal transfer protein TrbF [Escherichia coli]ECH9768365.1 conjugal transfer protein TrbF [Salmonella enterica subsp. enterica]EEZ5974481.1 F-type conjugal transfer protein TrbF [Escherichia coli O2]EGR6931602.1 F-type conjugal transfer protein TrbF [Salmonella enterica]EIL5251823.1 F-type conjugal transfer protein TrbF [Salmonella enterica subsp. enterica serovar Kentucky]EEW2011329.1 conjugal transfer protein TrbF [Escherichia coli]